MNPEDIAALRSVCRSHIYTLRSEGKVDLAEAVTDLLNRLPPDPGGEMPDPWPGMVVEDRFGVRATVERVLPVTDSHPDGARTVQIGGYQDRWAPDHVREVRSPDGRVLWRAPR